MCNHLHLQEKLLEEHRQTMQREMAQKRLLTRPPIPHTPWGRHLVGILGTRLIVIGMRLEQVGPGR